jgi:hypothetical protein
MNQEIGQEWVLRLRSGKERQGRDRLRDEQDQKCCLGVLGDILVERGLARWENEDGEWWLYPTAPSWRGHFTYPSEIVLPGPLLEGVDLDEGSCAELAAMNDGAEFDGTPFLPRTFEQIADHIEKKHLA